ncbi:MAG: thioredoxin domain-containing protein [bacterium]|nr:thioredoxin domain-containing protein [bacterium]
MRCPKCDYQNPDDALYCSMCQEILKKKNKDNVFVPYFRKNELEKPKSKSGFIFFIVIAIAIIIAGIYFYPVYRSNRIISDYIARNDNKFDQNVIQSELPVLVDFFAASAPPCQAMDPIIEELKIEYAKKIVVYKINADEDQYLIRLYNITGIPTYLFFKKGKEVGRITGAAPKEFVKSKIEETLKYKTEEKPVD